MPKIYFKSVPFSKEAVTLALESGVDGIITDAAHMEGVRKLALCDVFSADELPSAELSSKADEENLARRIAAGHTEDYQGSHRTDQNGVEKHLKHGPHALLLRRRLLSRSLQNGHAAKSGLIGEHASGHAILKALGDSISRSTRYSCSRL